MTFDLFLQILRIGGSSAGTISLLLIAWIYFNHQHSVKNKIDKLFNICDGLKAMNDEQNQCLARYDERLKNIEKQLDKMNGR